MSLYLDDGDVRLYHGDAIETCATLPEGSVDCCITSPPYFGLRDYGVDGQIGLEGTPEAFIARLVDVFRGVRRVLTDHGTCWVNLGDSYAGGSFADGFRPGAGRADGRVDERAQRNRNGVGAVAGAKPKDLLMMPARLALALQADGWWLRSDIIWAKPNPMPESVTDRPTSAHEHVFLFAKASRYWYDADAIRERGTVPAGTLRNITPAAKGSPSTRNDSDRRAIPQTGTRNARNVWTIPTQPTPEAHFATFPEELVRRALLAGCPEQVCRECGEPRRRIVERDARGHNPSAGAQRVAATGGAISGGVARSTLGVTDGVSHRAVGWSDCGHGDYRTGVVLDPFMGSGTTAVVARAHARHAIGIDLNREYLEIAARRTQQLGLLA